MRPTTTAILTGITLACASAAPASQKPCRTSDGRVIACPKPQKATSPRCKDEQGRFIPCKPAPPPKSG